jgi:ATP-dependent Lon protease
MATEKGGLESLDEDGNRNEISDNDRDSVSNCESYAESDDGALNDGFKINSDDSSQSSVEGSMKRKRIKHLYGEQKRKKTEHVDAIQSIVAEMMEENDPKDDLSEQILNYLRDFNWKKNLTNSEIKILEPLYDKICGDISKIPKIDSILALPMPYEEKCDTIEKILILYNAQPNTFEFLQLKRHLNKTIEKYKLFSMSNPDYERYKKIEETLTESEREFKPLKYQILDTNMSETNKAYIYQRYKYFSTLDNSNSEYNKLKQWLDTALNLPNEIKPISIVSDGTGYEVNKYLWKYLDWTQLRRRYYFY